MKNKLLECGNLFETLYSIFVFNVEDDYHGQAQASLIIENQFVVIVDKETTQSGTTFTLLCKKGIYKTENWFSPENFLKSLK